MAPEKEKKSGRVFLWLKKSWQREKAEIAEGKYFPQRKAQNILFSDFALTYYDRHWQHLRGKGAKYFHNKLLSAFGNKTLASISTGDLQDFYNAKRDETSAATANRYLARLAHMFSKAKQWKDFHGDNPATNVEKGKENNHRIRFLEKERDKPTFNCL